MQFMHQVFIGDKVKHSFDDAESIKKKKTFLCRKIQ